jgi:hypothetical protein
MMNIVFGLDTISDDISLPFYKNSCLFFFSRERKMAEFRSAAEADPEIAAWGKKVATTFGLVSQ